jgi:hypothetical protein
MFLNSQNSVKIRTKHVCWLGINLIRGIISYNEMLANLDECGEENPRYPF